MTLAGVAGWLALVFVGVVHAAGGFLGEVATVSVLVAVPVSTAAAVRAIASYWRGPDIISFGRGDAEACTPAEAEFVRTSVQLRGMIGGAGFLYPRRLVFPAAAWLAAALVGAGILSASVDDSVGPWPVVVALAAGFASYVFPARPYFYRDTKGGGALVSPASAASRLRRRAAIAGALLRGEAVEASTPAPTPLPSARLEVARARSSDPLA